MGLGSFMRIALQSRSKVPIMADGSQSASAATNPRPRNMAGTSPLMAAQIVRRSFSFFIKIDPSYYAWGAHLETDRVT
jgi:hypothetical protein